MRPSCVLVLAVPLALGACGVPDLVAHGVKAYERNRDGTTQAQAEPQQPPPPPATVSEPPAAAPVSVPPRESVTVEPLTPAAP